MSEIFKFDFKIFVIGNRTQCHEKCDPSTCVHAKIQNTHVLHNFNNEVAIYDT